MDRGQFCEPRASRPRSGAVGCHHTLPPSFHKIAVQVLIIVGIMMSPAAHPIDSPRPLSLSLLYVSLTMSHARVNIGMILHFNAEERWDGDGS